MTKTKFSYYNYDKVMSYNAVYNFILGARGLGKTYGAKSRVIINAIKRGEEFIYLRRYKTELTKAKSAFFSDIFHAFPTHKFRINGSVAQMQSKDADEKNDPWVTIGHFASLSTSQSYKSVAFPKVTTIIFDEFIIEKGGAHYLSDEANLFNDFYSTVDRYNDRTKVFFLANAISIMNPYFLTYKIKSFNREWVTKADGFIVVHFADSKDFGNEVSATRFGKFITEELEDYADYAVSSNFKDDSDNLVKLKPSTAAYFLTLETPSGVFSVWIDNSDAQRQYYVQEKRPKQELLFTTIAHKVGNGYRLMVYSDKTMQYFRAAYKNGNVYFDTSTARNAFIDIFKR